MMPEEKRDRIASLTNTIENFNRKNLQNDARCFLAMEELNRLRSHLEPRKSVAAIRRAAEKRRYVSYGDIGAESGLPWQEARRTIDRHLDELCRWAHARGWPLITAIVVEKPNLTTGKLDGIALRGFLATAERLSISIVPNGADFLRAQQEKVFRWAEDWCGRDVFAVSGVGI